MWKTQARTIWLALKVGSCQKTKKGSSCNQGLGASTLIPTSNERLRLFAINIYTISIKRITSISMSLKLKPIKARTKKFKRRIKLDT